MKRELISLMLVISLSGFAFGQTQSRSSAKSDNEGWVKIGEKTVNLNEHHGIFDLNKDREKTINANERYSAIRFKAKEAPVNLTNVEIQYDDGAKQNLNINSPVKVNSESKIVTLDDDKKLDKITFNYETNHSAKSDKAKVEVWGLRATSSGGMGSRSDVSLRDEDKAWEKLGEKTVMLHENRSIFNWNTDREKSINANEKYSAIKFRAIDAPVNLTNVEIQYDNGQKKDLNINSPVPVNRDGKIISLDNDQKLDKITFNYKKDESAKVDKAKIEVWGLKADNSGAMGQRDHSKMDRDNDRHDQKNNRNK
jgi:hypothetical protein